MGRCGLFQVVPSCSGLFQLVPVCSGLLRFTSNLSGELHRASPEFHNIKVSDRLSTGWKWNPCHCGERPLIYRLTVYHSISSAELTMDLKRV